MHADAKWLIFGLNSLQDQLLQSRKLIILSNSRFLSLSKRPCGPCTDYVTANKHLCVQCLQQVECFFFHAASMCVWALAITISSFLSHTWVGSRSPKKNGGLSVSLSLSHLHAKKPPSIWQQAVFHTIFGPRQSSWSHINWRGAGARRHTERIDTEAIISAHCLIDWARHTHTNKAEGRMDKWFAPLQWKLFTNNKFVLQ